jgi:hypothetical protein
MNEALTRLTQFLGAQEATRIMRECVEVTGITEVRSPEDSLTLALALCKHGGMVEVVGRSIKAKAILRGARVAAA